MLSSRLYVCFLRSLSRIANVNLSSGSRRWPGCNCAKNRRCRVNLCLPSQRCPCRTAGRECAPGLCDCCQHAEAQSVNFTCQNSQLQREETKVGGPMLFVLFRLSTPPRSISRCSEVNGASGLYCARMCARMILFLVSTSSVSSNPDYDFTS